MDDNSGKNIEQLEAKAIDGDVEAQWKLACHFLDEFGKCDQAVHIRQALRVPEDEFGLKLGSQIRELFSRAQHWLELAAINDHPKAQESLGVLYKEGFRGIQRDEKKARYWCGLAAKHGSAEAQYALSELYLRPDTEPEDFAEGFKWCQKAAEQEHPEAEYDMGVCCEHGSMCALDMDAAMAWYRRAAEHGSALAKSRLGESE